MTSQPIIALIPAFQEAERISATVQAALALPGITRVVVVDDGSADDTATLAKAAGAEVIRQPQNAGKGAALRAGLAAIAGEPQDIILLLDADLGASAAEADALLEPVLTGEADVAIARFPKAGKAGGFGLVKGLARTGTWLLSRTWLQAPLSGQRACRRWALEAAPIADGYGAEVAMNVAAADAGARIVEVETTMTHAAKGRTLGGFKHRGRQGWHILGALLAAAFGKTGEPLLGKIRPARFGLWLLSIILLLLAMVVAGTSNNPLLALRVPRQVLGLAFGFIGVLVSGILLTAILSGLLRARRKNYRGRLIPALGGLVVGCTALVLLLPLLSELPVDISLAQHNRSWGDLLPELIPFFALAWVGLGLADDLAVNTERKGFRGHVGALLKGKLTSGGFKMLGGGLLALYMAATAREYYFHTFGYSVLLAGLLIALSANVMNLFDLRPGRALKVFWLAAVPLVVALYGLAVQYCWYHLSEGNPPATGAQLWPEHLLVMLLLVLLATVIYAPLDFAGMMMLGDTGSNPLGALLGLCLVIVLPLPAQAVAVLVLIAIHIYAEKASITGLIEKVGWLRWLDRLGRG